MVRFPQSFSFRLLLACFVVEVGMDVGRADGEMSGLLQKVDNETDGHLGRWTDGSKKREWWMGIGGKESDRRE